MGTVFSALAELEDKLGRRGQAMAFEETALRYRHLVGDPEDCAISHFNPDTSLMPGGGPRRPPSTSCTASWLPEYNMQELRSEDAEGCTVGVIHIPDGILFFKNRDLAKEHLKNRITVFQSTPEIHTLEGVNFKTKGLEGVSIGVNRHKICVANTHIATSADVPYDVLCERLVNEAQREEDVPRIVEDFMNRNRVQGGRILVSSPEWTFLVEVFEKIFKLKELERNFVITNSFSLIPHEAESLEVRDQSSANRLELASRMINSIYNIKALKSMLRSHIPEKGELSICNHRQDGGGTESSHIIQIQGDYVGWSSLIGYPCENDYHTTQLFQE